MTHPTHARLIAEQAEHWTGRDLPLSHFTAPDGTCWHVWTDGHMMIGFPGVPVPSDGVLFNAAGHTLRMLFALDTGGRATTAGRLLAWANSDRCSACKGSGRVDCSECSGTGEAMCDCPDCSGGCECKWCTGGTVTCDSCNGVASLGSLGDVFVSRGLVGRLLHDVDGAEAVTVYLDGPLSPVTLRGAEWCAVVMPIKNDGERAGTAFAGWLP